MNVFSLSATDSSETLTASCLQQDEAPAVAMPSVESTTAAIAAGADAQQIDTQDADHLARDLIARMLSNRFGIAAGVEETLQQLEEMRKNWEGNEMAASHRRLYSILTSCYALYLRLKNSKAKKDREAIKDGIERFIRSRGLRTLADTHDMTRVVKAVFGEDRRRVSAYAAALRVALTAGQKNLSGESFPIEPANLSSWITDCGGIEEIRKAKNLATVTQPRSERIAVAKAAVQAKPLTKVKLNTQELAFDSDEVDKPQVLIATYLPTGELEINCVIKTQSVVDAALSAYYAQHQTELQGLAAAAPAQSAIATALEETI